MSLEFDLDAANARIQELEEDLPLLKEMGRKLWDIRTLCDTRAGSDPRWIERSRGRGFAWVNTDELYPILDSGEYLT